MTWRRRFRRRSARVVLLDPDARVLLLRADAASDPAGRGAWYLPGGGVLPFESLESAAARELREEIGVRDLVLGPVIGERPDVSFTFRGRRITQDEWYLAGRVPSPHVGSGRHGDGERRAVEAHRWWSRAELEASGDAIHPPDLHQLVQLAAAWASDERRPGGAG